MLNYFLHQHLSGSYIFLPYFMDSDGHCMVNEGPDPTNPQRVRLEKKLRSVIQDMHMDVR